VIKQQVEEYKKRNGFGNNVSNKDLILYLLKKHDDFERYVKDKLEKGSGKIAENRTRSNMNWFILKILLTAFIVNSFTLAITIWKLWKMS